MKDAGSVSPEIEEKEIDHMTVEESVGKITEDAGEQKTERQSAPGIGRFAPKEQEGNHNQRDTGQRDEEAVVVGKRTKGGAGVSHMDKGEKIRNEKLWLAGIDEAQDQLLGYLIKRVER